MTASRDREISNIPFLDLLSVYKSYESEFDAAYKRVMCSGQWILGQELERFECEFADSHSAGYAVGVANGFDALELSLRAVGVKPGERVLVPAHTFIATWLAITAVGALPVPVEPSFGRFLPSEEDYIQHITPEIAAVIPVHLYGEMMELQKLSAACAEMGVHLVEDAAQAHGANVSGKFSGTYGQAGCFSFYPGKNLGAFGDGGAILTSSAELAETLRMLRSYGAKERYRHQIHGVNSRLDELQAAFLRVRLEKLDDETKKRRHIAKIYRKELAGVGDIQLPAAVSRDAHVWHLFVIRTAYRNRLQTYLAQRGVQTLIHYPKPCYRFPPFSEYGPDNKTPSDTLCDSILSLPMGPHMEVHEVLYVVKRIKSFFGDA